MEAIKAWEQQEGESSQAFEAFSMYLEMGADRSCAKVASRLGKSTQLMTRWSARDGWAKRALAWDRHIARQTNEEILVGTAQMRKRIIAQAQDLQSKLAAKLASMTDAEIRGLSPRDAAMFFRVASEAEAKARKVTEAELESVTEAPPVPTIHVHFLPPKPEGMVAARLATGETGWIPAENAERFKRDIPGAIVIM
jgi:hypothetical protein